MPTIESHFRSVWEQARQRMKKATTDEEKLTTMEIFGLRELAVQLLEARKEAAVSVKLGRLLRHKR